MFDKRDYADAMEYLKYNFFFIKEMKNLNKDSVRYKKMFKVIKSEFATQVDKYRRHIFICKVLLVFTAASNLLCLLVGGNNILPERIAAFNIIFTIMIVSGLLAGFFFLWANRYVKLYLEYLIEKFDVSMRGLSLERMRDIIEARGYYHDRIEENELCGCIHCMKTFLCDKAVEEYEDALCPYCKNAAILHERSKYPLSDDFLRQMHEYWIDE